MNHLYKSVTLSAAVLLASLSAVQAQTTLVDWTFDNSGITAPVIHPAPSSGIDISTATADTVGMTNTLTPTPSIGAPDVIANPAGNADSTPLLPDAWRIRAKGTTPNTGNGWSDAAAVGAQGTIFKASTAGYQNLKLAFDITATSAGEGYVQVEYTTDGVTWSNAPLTYAPNQALVLTNATPGTGTNDLVVGVYFSMVETGTFAQVWFTNITADLSGIAAANNNPNFAFKIVNAAKGTNCVSASNTALNNTSGNWSMDNIILVGTPPPVAITAWDFDTYQQSVMTNNPVPSLGAGTATPLGMANSYNSATSLPTCDIVATAGASTGSNAAAWRVRGGGGTFATAGSPNGWSSQAPLGTQGAEFDASTVGYNNIALAFDIFFTAQSPAQMQVEYTTDGVLWSNATTLAYAPNPAFILTNTSDPNTVTGVYFSQTAGSAFYTNITAAFPAAASGNPNFGVRIVNATTGPDSLTFAGAPYNNSSGNCRFDNVIISGTTGGSGLSTPPLLTPATGISVISGSFFIAIPAGNAAWQSAITNVTVGGVALLTPTFTNGITITPTQITFTTSASLIYQKSGNLSIVIGANGYSRDTVTQVLVPGVATQMVLTQPSAPTGDGGTLVVQPALVFEDIYNNVATGTVATVTATVGGSGTWTLAGATVQAAIAGTVYFTNLATTNPAAAYSSATITLTQTGSGVSPNFVTSAAFNIPAPSTPFTTGNLVVEQEDLATKNSTFSMLELNPGIPNQSVPVNTFPVPATSATGSNALRQSSSGSTGRLADSDDGTLVCFSGALCGDSTVADATTVDPRGAGTFDYSGKFTLQASYTGLGDATANQTRSAISADDTNWFMGDKGGVYTNGNNPINAYIPFSVSNPANVRSMKSFGGTIFVMQEEGSTDPFSPVLSILPAPNGAPAPIPGAPANGSEALFALEGFSPDGSVLDFYMLRSGNNGSLYDVAYYIDGTNTTSGALFKYYYTGQIDGTTGQQIWQSAGTSWPTPNGGDGLCARTNASGGVDLYYTTGSGGSPGNSVIMVHDSSAWNQPINLTSSNTLYTVSALATLKGIAFAPVNPNPSLVITPFNVTAGSSKYTGAAGSGTFGFSFTNAPGISGSFTILETTNLALPLSKWQVLGHPTEGSPGQYQFSDPSATNQSRFYSIHQP